MAAVLSPPHLHPGLIRVPGLAGRRSVRPQSRSQPRSQARPQSRPQSPLHSGTVERVVTAPTAATYRRRRAVALVLLVAVAAIGYVVVGSALSHVWGEVSSSVGQSSAAAEVLPANPGAAAPTEAAVAVGAPLVHPAVYVVRPGDTLWSIAQRLQPDADPRPLVDALAERAGSSALRPGQRIDLDGLAL